MCPLFVQVISHGQAKFWQYESHRNHLQKDIPFTHYIYYLGNFAHGDAEVDAAHLNSWQWQHLKSPRLSELDEGEHIKCSSPYIGPVQMSWLSINMENILDWI